MMPCELFHLVPGLLDQSREGHTPALPSHSHHHAVFASDLVRTVSIWLLHWPHRLLYLDHLIWAQAFTVGASTSTHFCSSSNHTSTLLTHPVCQHLQFRSPTYDGECDIDLLSVTETMWWSMGSYSALSYRTIISPRRPKKGHTKSPPPVVYRRRADDCSCLNMPVGRCSHSNPQSEVWRVGTRIDAYRRSKAKQPSDVLGVWRCVNGVMTGTVS